MLYFIEQYPGSTILIFCMVFAVILYKVIRREMPLSLQGVVSIQQIQLRLNVKGIKKDDAFSNFFLLKINFAKICAIAHSQA